MEPKQLRRQWRRALKSSLRRSGELLRRRGPLNADAVHDLRVSLRRTRLLLQLRGRRRDRVRIKRHRVTTRKIMDAFAPARDADVALEWARSVQASPALLTRLLGQRSRQCRRAERKLSLLKPRLRSARVTAAVKVDADKLFCRYRRWVDGVSARCLATAARAHELSPMELHALRCDIRRWRYLRELGTTCRPVARDRTVRSLAAAQTSLGAIQDVVVVLKQMRSCPRSREVISLRSILKHQLEADRRAAVGELSGLVSRNLIPED